MEKKKIDPWGSGLFNKYETLYHTFGIEPIDDVTKEYFKDTYLFERDLLIGHRDFGRIMKMIKEKKNFIMISGFASSGEFHLGHKVIVDVYNYFRKFAKKGYFVICDLDAYVSRPDAKIPDMSKSREYAVDNIANALALGVKQEDIIVQSKQPSDYFTFSHMISKKLTFNTMKAALGHDDLGKFASCYLQIADILYPQVSEGRMPSLIPVGIDQEPLIRLTRDVSKRFSKQFDLQSPSSIYVAHLPSLKGGSDKMSKAKEGSAILLKDSKETLAKVVEDAFTGGRETEEEQKKLGGTPNICPVYSLYKFHMDNQNLLDDIYKGCTSGSLLCGEDKTILYEFLSRSLESQQKNYIQYLDVARKMVDR